MFGFMAKSEMLLTAHSSDHWALDWLATAAVPCDHDELLDLTSTISLSSDEIVEYEEEWLADKRATCLLLAYFNSVISVIFLARVLKEDKQFEHRYEGAVRLEEALSSEVHQLVVKGLTARGGYAFPVDRSLRETAAKLNELCGDRLDYLSDVQKAWIARLPFRP